MRGGAYFLVVGPLRMTVGLDPPTLPLSNREGGDWQTGGGVEHRRALSGQGMVC